MENNKVDVKKNNQIDKKSMTIAYLCAIGVLYVLAFVCFWLSKSKKDSHFTRYNQSCDVDYKVYLKKNAFYKQKYLDENSKYIAKLTDYIEANMKYNANFEDDMIYKYKYRIEAFVNVIEKGENKVLYSKNYSLINKSEEFSNDRNLNISEKLNINYHRYNTKVKKFVSLYDLNNIDSTLTINMYVDISNEHEAKESAKVTLSIPLLVDTMKFDVSNDISGQAIKTLRNSNKEVNTKMLKTVGTLALVAVGVIIILILCQNKCVSTPLMEYNKERNKILSNYGPYIQKLTTEFNTDVYQVLHIEDFRGLLEIRDTIRQPILMSENKEKTMTTFVIPGENKVLYKNVLKVNEE